MNENKFFDILARSIVSIKNNDSIISGNFNIIMNKSKYSSTYSRNIFIEGIRIPVNKKTKIEYKCGQCNNINEILGKRFLSKSNTLCVICKEKQDTKRNNQSERIKKIYRDRKEGLIREDKHIKKQINIYDLINISNDSFLIESSEFIRNYYNRNLTVSDFNKIRNHILMVNGVKISDDFIFIEHLKNNNQFKYSQYLLNPSDSMLLHINTRNTFICDCCGKDFNSTRQLTEKIRSMVFLCRYCGLSNNSFRRKSIKNIEGTNIIYQSIPELNVIKISNSRNLLIENGPKIKYWFAGKEREYWLDFKIDSLKIFLEIKQNHIWYKRELESGKWKAKSDAAKKFSADNGFNYIIAECQNEEDIISTLKI